MKTSEEILAEINHLINQITSSGGGEYEDGQVNALHRIKHFILSGEEII